MAKFSLLRLFYDCILVIVRIINSRVIIPHSDCYQGSAKLLCMYRIRQNKCNLEENAVPCVPHFDGRAAVRCLVKCHDRWIVALFVVRSGTFAELRHVWQKVPQYRIPALPAQIHRQTIKLLWVFLSDCGAQNKKIVAFFLTYTVNIYT